MKGLSIYSYTEFGEDLERKHPESILIKLINKAYSKNRDLNIRDAMVEFNILKEACYESVCTIMTYDIKNRIKTFFIHFRKNEYRVSCKDVIKNIIIFLFALVHTVYLIG